jgi:hypothetical protein
MLATVLDDGPPLGHEHGIPLLIQICAEIMVGVPERHSLPIFELANDRSGVEAAPREGLQRREVVPLKIGLQDRDDVL